MDKRYYEGEEKIIDNRDPEVQHESSPAQQVHNRLLNLRDILDSLSVTMTEKLAPVMVDVPLPCGNITNGIAGSLPPLFAQYDDLIDHIVLVVRDITSKLDSVSI